jgi:hypothetical protein
MPPPVGSSFLVGREGSLLHGFLTTFPSSFPLSTELVADWYYVQVPLTDGAPPLKYTFDKYNRPLEIPEYSDEEYSRVLQDPRWSREETDHLWGLARQFELRFIVMADRWALPKVRSVEEMKERYYSVGRKLLLARAQDEEDVADHPLIKVSTGSPQIGVMVWAQVSSFLRAQAAQREHS